MNYIEYIVKHMLDFQSKNLIKNECMTNVQYLYDQIKMRTNIKCIVKPVMVIRFDGDNINFCHGHFVIEIDGEIIDPSYDVSILKNKHYFYTIKDLIDSFDKNARTQFIEKCKHGFNQFLAFIKIANKMNKGIFNISNKVFYNSQADYIDLLNKTSI